jgi:hypothetical protein
MPTISKEERAQFDEIIAAAAADKHWISRQNMELMCKVKAALSEAEARAEEAEKMAEPNQREHDLLRQMRAELHGEDLITDEEYAALASEHGGVERLMDYDQIRVRAETAERERNEALRGLYHCEDKVEGLYSMLEPSRQKAELFEKQTMKLAAAAGRAQPAPIIHLDVDESGRALLLQLSEVKADRDRLAAEKAAIVEIAADSKNSDELVGNSVRALLGVGRS